MLRRQFLQQGLATVLAAATGQATFAGRHAMKQSQLCDLSAVAAIGAMRRGDLSAESYAAALLACCQSNIGLNAFISLEPERVLEGARRADLRRRSDKVLGPLHGLPIPVKDSVNSVDLPTSAGTAALRSFRPAANAPVLQSLLSAGALLLGKTNLHELSLGVTSNNLTFGACHNPYDPTRSPGGSSGGSAVAVSARMAPLSVGEDTTCSIRVPAAMCGIAGLRPSTGRYPQAGVMPITPKFDSIGPLARSVADLVLFDQVLRPDTQPAALRPLRQLRLGVPPTYWTGVDPQIERVAIAAMDKLRNAGVQVVRVDIPEILRTDLATVMDVLSYEVVSNETVYLRDQSTGVSFEQMLAQMSAPLHSRFTTTFVAGSKNAVPEERYRAALQRMDAIREGAKLYFRSNNLVAIAFPPTLTPALPIGIEGDIMVRGEPSTVRTAMLRNTVHAACVGMPGLVLPAGLTESGLPVGMEFDMLPGDDRPLLSLGLSLERVLGPVMSPRGVASGDRTASNG
jgi:indoleacetamide hydrolase